jgi:PAS domain-containing protein
VAGAIVVSLDVTDEMRLSSREDTAREHGRHLAEFINSPTMVIGQGHVTLANDAAERHLGYEPGKLLNAAAETVMTPESARLIENNFQPGKSAEQITLDLISRDGRPLPTVFAAHASKVNGHVEVLLIAVGSKPEVGEASAKKAGPTNPPKTRKKSSSRKAPAKRVAPRIISTLRDEPKPKPKKRS